ncbi:MAG: Calx-beta domain-containing protein [Actinomycetota bacterium]
MQIRAVAALVLLCLVAQAGLAGAAGAHDMIWMPAPDAFTVESEGAAIEVRRGTHGQGTATVRAATTEGTATPGSDYTPQDETLVFPQPIGAHEVIIPVVDDSDIEPLETIGIELSEPTGGVTIAGTGAGSISVVDNDGPARVSFAKSGLATYENFREIQLVVVRSGSVQAAASVDYTTTDGGAVVPADYVATSGTITFDVGQRIKRLTVPLVDDDVREDPETFTVGLSNLVGADPAEPSTATVSIEDDENPASDVTAPSTFFHQPLDGRTYRPHLIRDFLVQTDDIGSGIDRVQIALRAKMRNGRCRWYKHRLGAFAAGPCDRKVWGIDLAGADTVYYSLRERLRSSRGTGIRNYTAWSRGIDQVGNVERSFARTRNLSTFEVR